jgi:hypothetical protein
MNPTISPVFHFPGFEWQEALSVSTLRNRKFQVFGSDNDLALSPANTEAQGSVKGEPFW